MNKQEVYTQFLTTTTPESIPEWFEAQRYLKKPKPPERPSTDIKTYVLHEEGISHSWSQFQSIFHEWRKDPIYSFSEEPYVKYRGLRQIAKRAEEAWLYYLEQLREYEYELNIWEYKAWCHFNVRMKYEVCFELFKEDSLMKGGNDESM